MILEVLPVGPLQCNCVILGDEVTKEAIVVDPGDEIAKILAILKKHQLQCKLIVHTHTHIDHAGGTAILQKATGAKVALHEKDLFLFENLNMQAQFLGFPEIPDRTDVDHYLKDGETLSFGHLRGEILHTPGHTPGSLCLHLPDSEKPLLLSGDTLFKGSIGRTDLWGGSYDDIMTSLHKKLIVLPEETLVLPGHGPATTIGQEKQSNPFVQG